MSSPFWSDRGQDKKPTLRRSQTITVFGIGAIADLPDASVMICGIEKWDTRGAMRLSDPRLEKKLGAPYFLMPPDTDQSKDGIRAIRFPRWMRCRKCGSLRGSKDWRQRTAKARPDRDFDRRPFCDICSVPLIPSRFIVACRLGHIDDFPYVEWVHGSKECTNPDLRYGESGRSASLAGITISCKSCKASRSMRGAFSKQSLSEVTGCKGSKPWAGKWEGGCGEALTGLLRGGTNVHFPVVRSSILIPPFTSENLKIRIANTRAWQVYESQDGGLDKQTVATLVSDEIGEKSNTVLEAINDMEAGADQDKEDRSEEEYRYDEYRAFLGDVHREKDFEIEPVPVSEYGIPFLKNVVLVKKLREIRVQTGFSRIRPPQNADEEGGDEENAQEAIQEVSVSDDRSVRWRPAYEVRGEGIFLEFDAATLSKWAGKQSVRQRSKLLIDRFSKNPDAFAAVDMLTPEYLLLHSLSHLLIRQLSFECGYGSSALRERIYCSSDQNKRSMTGILIYTADGDSDGTMGGLVRQGRSDYFPRTLYEAVTSARWCSSDPLCIESEGQGYQSMNLAACHACAMLPETSCEIMNRYIDRAMVVGTISDPETGLLAEWADKVTKSR